MAVGLGPLSTLHPVPGFELGIASAGIKRPGRKDVVVMRCAEGSSVAGVFTLNAFCAAPVTLAKQRFLGEVRYLLTNTGNANAGTGEAGLGLTRLREDPRFVRMVLPGNVIIERGMDEGEANAIVAGVVWHRYQMPAYHLIAADGDGITLVNIGVGPSNAKNITDHLAVLRPHCWLMIGHCGGLRQSQTIGD